MGRPKLKDEEKRAFALQLSLTSQEHKALLRLVEAEGLARGRDVPAAELARELLLEAPRMQRALALPEKS